MQRLTAILLLLLLGVNAGAGSQVPADPLESSQWVYMARKYFRDAPVVFDPRVEVVAPAHASESLATPVQVRAAPGLGAVSRVLVFADQNPIPRVLDYYPLQARPDIGFSFEVQQATPIRAAMRTADGVWHVGGIWIDAQGGGCTVPTAAGGGSLAGSRLGEIDARLWRRPGGRGRLKVRIMHPMTTGLAASEPAFFIRELAVHDGEGRLLARLEPREPVAGNPVFTLDIDTGGPVILSGYDNDGNRFQARIEAPNS